MSLEHPCFISYRHNPGPNYKRIIKDLYEALSDELGNFINDKKIFIDDSLQGGDIQDDKIAKALCESACMILAFTPTYFSKDHLYCAREFRAMEAIELKRLTLLNSGTTNNRGLIIPIILRGEPFLPPCIKNVRTYINFNNYMPSTNEENILYRDYYEKIIDIVEYIHTLYSALEEHWDTSLECKNFKLPTEAEVRPWVDSLSIPAIEFPGRRRRQ